MAATLTMERRQRKARKTEESNPPGMVLTEYQEQLLEQSLYDSLGLPERTVNHLENIGVLTLRDLLAKTREELLAIPNFGEKTLAEVYARLEDVGFVRRERREEEPDRPAWLDHRKN